MSVLNVLPGLARASEHFEVPVVEQVIWRVVMPVFWNGLASQTDIAAPWNRPAPPRSCMRRSVLKL